MKKKEIGNVSRLWKILFFSNSCEENVTLEFKECEWGVFIAHIDLNPPFFSFLNFQPQIPPRIFFLLHLT